MLKRSPTSFINLPQKQLCACKTTIPIRRNSQRSLTSVSLFFYSHFLIHQNFTIPPLLPLPIYAAYNSRSCWRRLTSDKKQRGAVDHSRPDLDHPVTKFSRITQTQRAINLPAAWCPANNPSAVSSPRLLEPRAPSDREKLPSPSLPFSTVHARIISASFPSPLIARTVDKTRRGRRKGEEKRGRGTREKKGERRNNREGE